MLIIYISKVNCLLEMKKEKIFEYFIGREYEMEKVFFFFLNNILSKIWRYFFISYMVNVYIINDIVIISLKNRKVINWGYS